jgi:hypothetical protein
VRAWNSQHSRRFHTFKKTRERNITIDTRSVSSSSHSHRPWVSVERHLSIQYKVEALWPKYTPHECDALRECQLSPHPRDLLLTLKRAETTKCVVSVIRPFQYYERDIAFRRLAVLREQLYAWLSSFYSVSYGNVIFVMEKCFVFFAVQTDFVYI